MQKRFRENIKQHFPELVDKINPETFAYHLLKKRVLKKGEVNKILANREDYKHNNRLLIFQILKKNDTVYNEFVKGLELFQLKHLFTLPRSHITVFNPASQNTPDELTNFSNLNLHNSIDRIDRINSPITRVNYDEKPLDVKVNFAKNFQQTDLDNTYSTKSSKRGQVLIINNAIFVKHSTREGSEQDIKCLHSLFKQMSFNVEIHKDLSVAEMEEVIKEFSAFESDKISDICVVIIMSHGEEREKELVVLDKLNDGLKTSWIEERFSNRNCSLFAGKPKIFFYQICRGSQDDYAITPSQKIDNSPSLVHSLDNIGDSVQTDSGHISSYERRLEDMLVGYATQKGHTAHRDPTVGSWYIQLICQVFMEKAHNTHIVDMLNEVDRKLKLRTTPQFTMQTSSYTSNGFNKLLYFNPGIYLDDVGNVQRFV